MVFDSSEEDGSCPARSTAVAAPREYSLKSAALMGRNNNDRSWIRHDSLLRISRRSSSLLPLSAALNPPGLQSASCRLKGHRLRVNE
jgi:hypothetical protein